MSTENGREAAVPSFGDLFDDPEPSAGAPADQPLDHVGPAYDEPADGSAAEVAEAAAPDEDDMPVNPAGVAPFEHPADDTPAPPRREPLLPPVREPEPMDEVPAVVAAGAPAVTGRLYRSAGAEGPATDGAIPAIDPEYLAARDAQRVAEGSAAAAAAAQQGTARPARQPATQGGSGLTWSGVVVVVMLGTILVGFADALINNSLGIITGIALLVSSVYCALLVRPADIWAAAIIPPLAFLAATLTAGQLTLDSAGSLVVREGYMILKTLAQNAPWIVGTTLVCLVIVLVRRRRAATHA